MPDGLNLILMHSKHFVTTLLIPVFYFISSLNIPVRLPISGGELIVRNVSTLDVDSVYFSWVASSEKQPRSSPKQKMPTMIIYNVNC